MIILERFQRTSKIREFLIFSVNCRILQKHPENHPSRGHRTSQCEGLTACSIYCFVQHFYSKSEVVLNWMKFRENIHAAGLLHFKFTGFSSFLFEIVFWVTLSDNLSEVEEHWVNMSSFLLNLIQFDSILFNFTKIFTNFHSILFQTNDFE